jgi:hypothetical protein
MTQAELLDALARAVYEALFGKSISWAGALLTMREDAILRCDVAVARTAARAALRFLGFVDSKGEVYCPPGGTMMKVREALSATVSAYQGVGDFERTGENMVVVIGQVKAALAALEGGR